MEIVVEPARNPSTTADSDTEQQCAADNIRSHDNPEPEVTMRQRRRVGPTREESFVFLDLPDNEVEEHKMTQNYMVSRALARTPGGTQVWFW